MKTGIKRLLTVFLFTAIPMVTAQPVSMSQDAVFALSAVRVQPVVVYYGMASWYSKRDPGINRHTANGEVFDDKQLTCASWDWPFHTRLEVTNIATQKSVVCRVNDRGPAKRLNRLIDLTEAAFRHIAPLRNGLVDVAVKPLPDPETGKVPQIRR